MPHASRLTFAIAGAGSRGRGFAQWVKENMGDGAMVAVAEPILERRDFVGDLFGIPSERRFTDWQSLVKHPKLADILINTTMDGDHHGSTIAALNLGYHMMLEKPIATTLSDVAEIEATARKTGRVITVCHSLRYHAVYGEVRKLLRSGVIGDIVSLDQLEAVENIHQSHSFVRGNWGNEDRSTYMLLAKSCHDIDIIADLIKEPCEHVSSFGRLTYFAPQNTPPGAPKRCTDGCPHESSCPYHAVKLYGDGKGWGAHVGFSSLSKTEILEQLKSGPYGKCVFQTDNDVVDHQVVAMEFRGGITATFTMTGFTPWGGRYLRIHGTKGYIEAKIDHRTIDVYEFWENNKKTTIQIPEVKGGHGGGDSEVMRTLVNAVLMNDPTLVLTAPTESLRSFCIVEAAERSRRSKRIVSIDEIESEATGYAQRIGG